MLYTLNNNYVLRQELNDCYRLYNKKTLRSYTISYKLFFILEQFRKQSYSLEHLIDLKSATIIQYTIKGRFMSR